MGWFPPAILDGLVSISSVLETQPVKEALGQPANRVGLLWGYLKSIRVFAQQLGLRYKLINGSTQHNSKLNKYTLELETLLELEEIFGITGSP